jgi:hypothetical protein
MESGIMKSSQPTVQYDSTSAGCRGEGGLTQGDLCAMSIAIIVLLQREERRQGQPSEYEERKRQRGVLV